MDNQTSVGPPSEKTERNIRRARSHSLWVGPYHLEWKAWTGGFRFLPAWSKHDTEFWNEGPVRWFRLYWLTGGLSIYWAFPERRVEQISNGWPNRRITYGTSEAYSRRDSGD